MQPVEFYTKSGINYMNSIEQANNKLMSECYPELEASFWAAVDSKNKRQLIFIINQLAKILDELRATVGTY